MKHSFLSLHTFLFPFHVHHLCGLTPCHSSSSFSCCTSARACESSWIVKPGSCAPGSTSTEGLTPPAWRMTSSSESLSRADGWLSSTCLFCSNNISLSSSSATATVPRGEGGARLARAGDFEAAFLGAARSKMLLVGGPELKAGFGSELPGLRGDAPGAPMKLLGGEIRRWSA